MSQRLPSFSGDPLTIRALSRADAEPAGVDLSVEGQGF